MALIGYKDWVKTYAGKTVAGAPIELRSVSDNSWVTLYTDATGTKELSNPFSSGADGSFEFYAEPGQYTLYIGADRIPVPVNLVSGRDQLGSIALLCLGQSNMAIDPGATGGRRELPSDVYLWDSDTTGATYTFGTQYNAAAFGTAPLNVGSAPYANSLALQAAINLRETTGRAVYVVLLAKGAHGIEAFITDTTLAANGWTRDPSDEDLTAYYGSLTAALAAIPGSPTKFEAVAIHQGEENETELPSVYGAKILAALSDLEATGTVSEADTRIAAGGILQGRTFRSNHKAGWLAAAGQKNNLVFVDSGGLGGADAAHFSGDGVTEFGKRYSGALVGGDKGAVQTIALGSGNDVGSYTDLSDQNPSTTIFQKVAASGAAVVFVEPKPQDGASAATLGVFRNTDTSGEKVLRLYNGDGTSGFFAELSSGGVSQIDGDLILGGLSFDGVSVMRGYADGALTLEVADAPTGGNVAAATVSGEYVRIGSSVTVWCRALNIDTTGLTPGNPLYLRGLPFVSDPNVFSVGSVVIDGITISAGRTAIIPRVLNGTSAIDFRATGSNITDAAVLVSDVQSSSSDLDAITITYKSQ